MKSLILKAGLLWCLCFGVLGFAQADVAVVLQLSSTEVTLQQWSRQEASVTEQTQAAIRQLRVDVRSDKVPTTTSLMVIEWLDASGVVLLRETRDDPRFIHAPGGQAVVLSETVMLIRGPAASAILRVRPRNAADFTVFHL